MNDKVFHDTNILVYLYSVDDDEKRRVALSILDKHICFTSIQVLNEASNVWFKRLGWTGEQIYPYLDNIEHVCDAIVNVNRDTINLALILKDRYRYSYFDCLVLASALESECSIIYTEDLSNGQVINDRLVIVNPFS